MKVRINSFGIISLKIIWMLLWAFIISLNFFCSNYDYFLKKEFLLPNIVLAVLGLLLLSLGYYILSKTHCETWKITTATILLFIFQIYIFENILFFSNWDVRAIYTNADMIAKGEIEGLSHSYFSWCPNNQMIVLIQSVLLKIYYAFDVISSENGLMFIVIIQCAISSYAGKCLFDIIKKLTNSDTWAWIGWFVYVILIGLSGWNVVTYTDIFTIAFPLVIFKIFLSMRESKVYVSFFLIILLSFWGFKIKPTVLIVFIALVIVELLWMPLEIDKNVWKEKVKKIAIIAGMGIISVAIYSNIFSSMIKSSGLEINKEADMGTLHMIMMGLNPENHGVWYADDMYLSRSIADKGERTDAQLEVITHRLKDYGVVGFVKHIAKKSLIVFNDGTFAWGCEGGFYEDVYPDKNEVAAPFLKSLYYNDWAGGDKNWIMALVQQLFWITSLFCSVGIVFTEKKKENLIIMLSLIGITLFEYLFEARARYVLIYVPFYIISSMIFLNNFVNYLRNRKVLVDE